MFIAPATIAKNTFSTKCLSVDVCQTTQQALPQDPHTSYIFCMKSKSNGSHHFNCKINYNRNEWTMGVISVVWIEEVMEFAAVLFNYFTYNQPFLPFRAPLLLKTVSPCWIILRPAIHWTMNIHILRLPSDCVASSIGWWLFNKRPGYRNTTSIRLNCLPHHAMVEIIIILIYTALCIYIFYIWICMCRLIRRISCRLKHI